MVNIEIPDSPLFEVVLNELREGWKGKPINSDVSVIMTKDELLSIIGENDFSENLRNESLTIMWSRFEEDGHFLTLCPNVSWDGKELTIDFRKEVIPYLLQEKTAKINKV